MKKNKTRLCISPICWLFFLTILPTAFVRAQGVYRPLVAEIPGELGAFVGWAVKTTIGLGLGLAVLMIVTSGFNMLLNPTNAGTLSKAKERLFDAIFGLAVIFLSYLALRTINPELVNFNF